MKLREHAAAIEEALMGFTEANMECRTEGDYIHNVKFTAYFITEMAKRWAERRYYEKQHGEELTIEMAIKRSQDATSKFFDRKERRRAPKEMKRTLAETADLRAFLEGKEPPEPVQEHQGEVEAPKDEPQNDGVEQKLPETTDKPFNPPRPSHLNEDTP